MEDIEVISLVDVYEEPVISQGELLYREFEQFWLGSSHCELSIILGMLEYMRVLHQAHHWVSMGDSFYGDHLLFSRLYDKITEEIDMVAEKAVGVSTMYSVNHSCIIQQMGVLDDKFGGSEEALIPNSNSLVKKSLCVEKAFLELMKVCIEMLDQKGELSVGIDNMLAALYDTHEGHVYLLKQRMSGRQSNVEFSF